MVIIAHCTYLLDSLHSACVLYLSNLKVGAGIQWLSIRVCVCVCVCAHVHTCIIMCAHAGEVTAWALLTLNEKLAHLLSGLKLGSYWKVPM